MQVNHRYIEQVETENNRLLQSYALTEITVFEHLQLFIQQEVYNFWESK